MADQKSSTSQGKSLLDEFIEGVRELPEIITSGAISASRAKGDLDEESIVVSFGRSLKETMVQTADLIADTAKRASGDERKGAEIMLRTMGASALISEAKNISQSLTIFGKKLSLAQLVQFIKKLIDWLLNDVFKIKIPWIKKLLDLINEILNALLGGGNSKVTHTLSLREQDYMNELAALANYEAASARLRDNDDGDDDY